MLSKKILQQLDAIEAEMKRIGIWDSSPPDLQEQVNIGVIKSYLDAPSFELWLQCIFIPNARTVARKDTLPTESQVSQMAMRQYNYHSFVAEAQTLLNLLENFDALINLGHIG